MPGRNAEVAAVLGEIADLLEVEGESPHRIRAYRSAARTVARLAPSLHGLAAAGSGLDDLPDIGPELAEMVDEIVRTGGCALLERLHRELPAAMTELLKVPGIGPKRLHLLHTRLGIRTLDDLYRAAEQGRVRSVPGCGPLIERRILDATAAHRLRARRFPRAEAEPVAQGLAAWLAAMPEVTDAIVVGRVRRGCDTVGRVDLLAVGPAAGAAVDLFMTHEGVHEVLSSGPDRLSVVLNNGLQADLRAVEPAAWGAASIHFTGSRAHVAGLRHMASVAGLKLNEQGLYRGRRRISGPTEDSVYDGLGLAFVPPELREDRGELEAARTGQLPDLVVRDDLRGDLHVHSRDGRGADTLDVLADAARHRGLDYLAITDATHGLGLVPGLDASRLARQIEAIDRFNAEHTGLRLLKGVEVEILEDGRLALPDALLRRLDMVIGALHTHLDLARNRQTTRLLRAMDNRHFSVLAHPTGRVLGGHGPCEIDLVQIVRHAKARGCYLELNAEPLRLDLDDLGCRLAREEGVLVSLGSGAAEADGLDALAEGVLQARRGWLTPADVLNTRDLVALGPLLRRTMV